MKGGQNAYDISCDMMQTAETALEALRTLRPDVAALLDGEAVAVPMEPTNKMLQAGDHALHDAGQDDPNDARFVPFAMARAEWRAMLAASPYAQKETTR